MPLRFIAWVDNRNWIPIDIHVTPPVVHLCRFSMMRRPMIRDWALIVSLTVYTYIFLREARITCNMKISLYVTPW